MGIESKADEDCKSVYNEVSRQGLQTVSEGEVAFYAQFWCLVLEFPDWNIPFLPTNTKDGSLFNMLASDDLTFWISLDNQLNQSMKLKIL